MTGQVNYNINIMLINEVVTCNNYKYM